MNHTMNFNTTDESDALEDEAFRMVKESLLLRAIRDHAARTLKTHPGPGTRAFLENFTRNFASGLASAIFMRLSTPDGRRSSYPAFENYGEEFRALDERSAGYAERIFARFDRGIVRAKSERVRGIAAVAAPVCAGAVAPWCARVSLLRERMAAKRAA
ncbi:hypothetical protein LVJ94_34745 [Pendulispora rubella]|uniref:Uncharacterized protein n=1 Tax=Pendulispora rubella TaxID=2741070 RepID=A0ABZ2KTM8_9BACT